MAARALQHDDVSSRHVRKFKPDHEVVCVGFGSSSIALAIALQEIAPHLNITFLERQSRSNYVPFNRSPGTYMQLSFLNDLVTQENPRSRFTFVSYLRATDQLIKFTNLGSIQPLREQFERYVKWCAAQFEHQVRYDSEVQAIRPLSNDYSTGDSRVDAWHVEYTEARTGEMRSITARHVVCAVGLQPSLPTILNNPALSRSIIHPSMLLDLLSDVAVNHGKAHHVVVVGQGLEAAEATEVVYNVRSPHLRVTWIQGHSLQSSRGTEGVTGDRLIEHQYAHQIRQPDARKRKLQIHADTVLKSASRDANGKIHLICGKGGSDAHDFIVTCDSIVAATGYNNEEYQRILQPIRHLLHREEISIDSHYGVRFRRDAIHDQCGIWLMGMLTSDSDVYDKSMAHVASWSKTIAEEIIGRLNASSTGGTQPYQISRARL